MGNLFTSTIGRKLIMSISGLFLILFLLFHMSMNIAAVFSTEAYNAICEFLGANWYALAGTLILAAGFVVHIIYASILTLHNRSSRGTQRYAVEATPKSVTWASRNMFVLGLVVVLGLLLHLYNFWYNMQFAEIIGDHSLGAFGPTDGAAYIADLFSNNIRQGKQGSQYREDIAGCQNIRGSLIVSSSSEYLAAGYRDGGVALDNLGEDTA